MSNLSMDEKKRQIVDNEEAMARQLARMVIDKPVPSVWMILIPVFFVYYAYKIKQYSNGLKEFTENYLVSRRRALDTAFDALQNRKPPDLDQLVALADTIPATVRPLYRDWMSLLVDHYCSLLEASGKSHAERLRDYYQNKSSYLLFCNQLNKREKAFSLALMPAIEGDMQDITYILEKMEQGVADLRRREVDEVFS
jgi:hypothetical protein